MSVLTPYLDYTQPVGWSTRVKECPYCEGMGNSKAVQITRKEDGFLWSCHRCRMSGQPRYSGFFPDKNASPSAVKQICEQIDNPKHKDNRPEFVKLPEYTEKWNPQGLVDLYDKFVEPYDIDRFNIGWSPQFKRVVFPLYRYLTGLGRDLVGWAGKKLTTEDDPKVPKWHTVRQRDLKHPRFIAVPIKEIKAPKRVVLVEDPISAIRISQLGYYSIALLTTYLPYELYSPLNTWDVIVWLDDDAYDKSCKYFASLNSNGVRARTVHTTRDPKELTPEEIQEELPWLISK